MDYRKHYDLLMEKARIENREKGLGQYYELHHIIPRAEGGSDEAENLRLLTAREHIIAHYLLWMEDPTMESRARSFWFMCQDIERRQVTISSRMYERAREAVVEANRTGEVVDCYICGKPHYRKKHTLNNARGHYFCSRECFGKSQEKHKEPRKGWTDASRKGMTEKMKGRVTIHNPETNKKKLVWPNEVDWFLQEGWKKGTGKRTATGKKWYNNGTKQGYFVKGEQPEGWHAGRLRGTTGGRKAISKDGIVKFVTDPTPWLEQGWVLGNEKYYPGWKHAEHVKNAHDGH